MEIFKIPIEILKKLMISIKSDNSKYFWWNSWMGFSPGYKWVSNGPWVASLTALMYRLVKYGFFLLSNVEQVCGQV